MAVTHMERAPSRDFFFFLTQEQLKLDYLGIHPPPITATMVLEDASNSSPETSFSENPPSSDADPYHGDSNPTHLNTRASSYITLNNPPHTIYVNLEQLPKPFTLNPFDGGRPSDAAVKTIQNAVRQLTQGLGRPVKQEEADALAYNYAKTLQTASYGQPLGIVLGGIWAHRGMDKYRFPGWTPGEKFNPNKFGPLTGGRARLAWQLLRYQVYTILGTTIGGFFMGSYALTQGTVGRMMDPRLKEIADSMRSQSKTLPGSPLPGNREVDETAGPRQGETYDMARQRQRAQEAWRRNRQPQQQQRSNQDDDMSPSGGAFGAEYIDLGSATVSDTSMMSDEQAKQQMERMERQQQSEKDMRELDDHQQVSMKPNERHRVADDASKTSTDRQSRSGGGSAWDRLRQQASSGNQQQQSAPRNASRSSNRDDGDSFSFSSSDEDRQLARAEAQKEFDSRIERERAGKDFEDRKRW